MMTPPAPSHHASLSTRRPSSLQEPRIDVEISSLPFGAEIFGALPQFATGTADSHHPTEPGEREPNDEHAADLEDAQTLPDAPDKESEQIHRDSDRGETSPRHNWRPLPMRNAYLVAMTLLSLAMGIGQETLYRLSSRFGSLLTFEAVSELTAAQWFCWRYLPPMVVIFYGIAIATADHQVMRLAPFYDLSGQRGLSGRESLLRNPANYFWYLRHPIKAGPRVWTSALATVLALVVVPPVQNASLFTTTEHLTFPHQITRLKVHSLWSRLLTVSLVLIACCSVTLQFLLRQSSGLSESPYGIAGVLSVIADGNVLEKLEELGVHATRQDIAAKLSHEHFALRNGCLWQITALGDVERSGRVPQPQNVRPRRCVPGKSLVFILVLLGIVISVLTVVLSLTGARDILKAVPWIGTAFAVVYKLLWGQFEVFHRGTEPYFQLWRGNAPPSVLFVDYTGLPIVVLPLEALRRKHYQLALLGLNSILAEVLVVCVASVSDPIVTQIYWFSTETSTQETTFVTFWVTLSLAASIPLIMTMSAIGIWIKRRKARLPRSPGSIASVLLYVLNSRLIEDVKTTRSITPRKRLKLLQARAKTYALGWFATGEGSLRLGIDEEPCVARYVGAIEEIGEDL
ncbi:uncharacterized protein PV07_11319 [Cladophialophora immunda]|uniref:Uncharacterized protein n=1 Tax=Cladophialophora immunda TaxID=569365 RepID=A0A0D2BVM1_9EURO|nr:uncharacterized protein PV07_11319 [Cladophialophora immunda]KIW23093.1 hypothetical protein PV07_11319 [Cladophialophora immunda]